MSGAVAVAEPAGGKRGPLVGGALTDEALHSSRGVLGMTRHGDIRGLQQFYTPREAAEFIKAVIDPVGRLPILDPTAGDGALLTPWTSDQRFGIEIDGDQVKAGDYHAITGDCSASFRCCASSACCSRRSSPTPVIRYKAPGAQTSCSRAEP